MVEQQPDGKSIVNRRQILSGAGTVMAGSLLVPGARARASRGGRQHQSTPELLDKEQRGSYVHYHFPEHSVTVDRANRKVFASVRDEQTMASATTDEIEIIEDYARRIKTDWWQCSAGNKHHHFVGLSLELSQTAENATKGAITSAVCALFVELELIPYLGQVAHTLICGAVASVVIAGWHGKLITGVVDHDEFSPDWGGLYDKSVVGILYPSWDLSIERIETIATIDDLSGLFPTSPSLPEVDGSHVSDWSDL